MVSGKYNHTNRYRHSNFDSANTLRILYQAQKQPSISTPPSEESTLSNPPPSEPEALDPRQQTLLKFFQPTPTPVIRTDMQTYNPHNSTKSGAESVQTLSMGFESDPSFPTSGSSTPMSTSTTGMDVNMDIDINMDCSSQGRWVGGIGWI